MQVLVFIDVTDPWAFIGVTRLERASATFTLMHGKEISLGLRSVQLGPSSAHDDDVREAARISGIDINLEDVVPADTFDAHRLLAWAGQSDSAAQQNLAHQLWKAHWLEGADIGDPLVLGSRAALAGLDLDTAEQVLAGSQYADEVHAQNRAAADLSITDLPVLMVEAQWRLDGLQSQDDYVQALERLWLDQR